ncbi:MAG: DNA polymerase ligase N-terminal domain-containing protein, partial [Acidimicrobiales bacterium]
MSGGRPADKLEAYRKKRDPSKTPEPVPKSTQKTSKPKPVAKAKRFVIQEHHATALHWDFRLERDGVLVSWAVPKGLPLDKTTNHLAIHTEDHPLEYASFEGDIPEDEYGGGKVILWDAGTYEELKWSDREVMVVLDGKRVEGKYVLFATAGGKEKVGDRNWMVHRMDEPRAGYRSMPKSISPMLASLGTLPKDDSEWTYEFKWDGIRAIAAVDGGRIKL